MSLESVSDLQGEQSNCSHQRVRIKVNSNYYETFESTLKRYPQTLLGKQIMKSHFESTDNPILYFNRSCTAFEAILFYYQSSGILVRPPMISMKEFVEECKFFQIDENAISQMKTREGYAVKKSRPINSGLSHLRYKAWHFFEYPKSSFFAKLFATFTLSLVAMSILISLLMTLPDVARSREDDVLKDKWFLLELTLHIIFAVEFFCRFLVAPNKRKFFKSIVNLIDLLAIYPYFIVAAVDAKKLTDYAFLSALRSIRVLRLIRLVQHFDTLDLVIQIITCCIHELTTLLLCLIVTCVISASILYYIEMDLENTMLSSIPQSMWWSIQTIICLGYGDVIPGSVKGKAAGAFVAIFGALTLTVPLLSIGGKYLRIYTKTFDTYKGPDLVPSRK